MQRNRLVPDMDTAALTWLHRTAKKNHWRVARWCDLEDLIQDGFMCWYKVTAQYCENKAFRRSSGSVLPPKSKCKFKAVTDIPHLMALFKLQYIGHLHDLSKQRSREPTTLACDLVPDGYTPDWLWDSLLSFDENDLIAVAAFAPPNIKRVLIALSNVDGKVLRKPYQVKHGRRETHCERLCKIAGLDPSIDIEGQLRAYLAAA